MRKLHQFIILVLVCAVDKSSDIQGFTVVQVLVQDQRRIGTNIINILSTSNRNHNHNLQNSVLLNESNSNNLVDDAGGSSVNSSNNANTEKAWRYVKKPLLRIGSKGVNEAHGNSLRQLLDAHSVVKVKVNINTNDFNDIFEQLRTYAIRNGASSNIELIQARFGTTERILLIGLPGIMEQIASGEFPPPPPPPFEKKTINN